MQKTIRLLALLLLAQALAAAGLSFRSPDLAARPLDLPLLTVDAAAIDRIVLADGDGETTELVKVDAGWQLTAYDGFPADAAKVEGLLRRLSELTHGAAVATTSSAQKRFKVSDDDFERRLTLAAGQKAIATLYLGSSPAMRRVHARRQDDSAVYAIDFAHYDAPASAEDWLDKTILQLPADDIIALQFTDLRLVRAAAATGSEEDAATGKSVWQAPELDQAPNQAAVDDLVRRLANLRINGVLGREAVAGYGLEQPLLTLTLERKGAEPIAYRLGKRADSDDYVLKASLRDEYFQLPSYTGEGLLEAASREALLAAPRGATEPAATEAQE